MTSEQASQAALAVLKTRLTLRNLVLKNTTPEATVMRIRLARSNRMCKDLIESFCKVLRARG